MEDGGLDPSWPDCTLSVCGKDPSATPRQVKTTLVTTQADTGSGNRDNGDRGRPVHQGPTVEAGQEQAGSNTGKQAKTKSGNVLKK